MHSITLAYHIKMKDERENGAVMPPNYLISTETSGAIYNIIPST